MPQVVIVSSLGPQGPIGPQGPVGPTGSFDNITGSLVTTASFNAFTSSYNTASFTGSFVGSGAGLFNIPASGITGLNLSQIATGSVTASVSTGTGSFTITSGSSNLLFISSSGQVGIGTTALTASLQIRGSGNTSGSYSFYVENSDRTGSFRIYNNGTISNPGANVNLFNEAFGTNALETISSGLGNTAVGAFALRRAINAASTTAIGYAALAFYSGSGMARTTAIGNFAMGSMQGGVDNTAVGSNAMRAISGSTASRNVAIGSNTLFFISTGTSNTVVGVVAGNKTSTGTYNVAIGDSSLFENTSGNENIAVGVEALKNNVTGSGNIAIGRLAGRDETTSNKLYIANTATSTPLLGGDFANTRLGINMAPGALAATLHVKGTGTTSSTTAFLVQNSAGTQLGYVDDSGQWMIGTGTNGGYKLDVNGTVRVSGSLGDLITISAPGRSMRFGLSAIGGTFNNITSVNPIGIVTDNFFLVGSNNSTSNAIFRVDVNLGTVVLGTQTTDTTSLLRLNSTTKGFLLPRTDLLSNISSPAQGLQTYITASATEGIYYYNSGSYQGWTRVLNNSGSQVISGSLELTSALTASNAVISGNVTVLGTASINTLIVNQTQLSTGSNQLGDAVNDTQTLYGTVVIPTGSLTVTGSITQTASTASFGGKVGIGTTAPAYALDTQGYGRFTSGVVVNAGQRISLGGSDYGSDALYSVGGGPLDVRAYYYTRFTRFNSGQGIQVIQVDGQALIKGAGATSSTTALLVQNSNASASLAVLDNGNVLIGTTTDAGYKLDVVGKTRALASVESIFRVEHTNGNYATIDIGAGGNYAAGDVVMTRNNVTIFSTNGSYFQLGAGNVAVRSPNTTFQVLGGFGAGTLGTSVRLASFTVNQGSFTATSGIQNTVVVGNGTNETWQPSSGNATYNLFSVVPVINTTGTYSGIVRGIYYNPTLTSMTGVTHRAIETTSGDIVFNGGNVGIGTLTPTASLHISGSSGSVLFEIDSNSQQNILYVSGSGNVGIGTSTPVDKLQILGDIGVGTGVSQATLKLYNHNATNYASLYSLSGILNILGPAGSNGIVIDTNANGSFIIKNNGNESLRILNNQNVGIGVTAPSAKLTVQGSGTTSSTTALIVQNANASTSLSVLDDGDVGIGTATPIASLDIRGTQLATGSIARTMFISSSLSASANNDVLVGLDINPTFANGAFTGVQNYALRLTNNPAFFGGDPVAMFITNNASIRGNATTGGILYIDGSRDLTGTIRLRATTVDIPGATSIGTLTATAITVSSTNTVSLVTGTGVTSFRIGNTTSSSIWYFENNRNAPAGSLEITNSISSPGMTFFSSRNVAINSNTDAGFKLDVNGTGRFSGNLTVSGSATNSLLVRGSGTTVSTTSLLVQNSAGTNLLSVRDDNVVNVGTLIPDQILFNGGTQKISVNGTGNATNFYSSGVIGQKITSQTGANLLLTPGTVPGNTVVIESTGGTSPNINNSAILQANSTTQGFLLPRTDLTSNIGTPARGLMTYVTASATEGLYYYNSGSYQGWTRVLNNSGSQSISGSVIIDNGLFDTVSTGSIPTGSTLIYTINTGSYQAGFFDYYVSSGSNFRAGNIMSVWGAGTYKFTDLATPDIGSTSNLQFSMSLSASSAQLFASASSAGWTVKTTFRTI
jgi:hypothetical protein